MKKLLLFCLSLCSLAGQGQDTLTAAYINQLVKRTEEQLQFLVMDKKDTLIYDGSDTGHRGDPLEVQTEYYFNLTTNHIEKIVERATYKTVVTELSVYYMQGQPIKMVTSQWDSTALKVDFDVFFMNNAFIHFTKRCNIPGKPDGEEYIKWCYELLRSYRPEG